MKIRIKREHVNLVTNFLSSQQLAFHVGDTGVSAAEVVVVVKQIFEEEAFMLGVRLQRHLSDDCNVFSSLAGSGVSVRESVSFDF